MQGAARQFQKILDSPIPQYFQNQDSYTHFLKQPFKEKSEIEKSIEILHKTSQQFQKSFTQSIDRLDAQLSQLVNIHRNKETRSYRPLTNPDISNSIDLDQESCCFGNQNSISAHPFELDQHQNFENLIDILVSYLFSEIELEHDYDPEPQLGNAISLSDSIMTPLSLPDFNPIPELVLNPMLVYREIESPIFYDHHI